MTSAYSGPPTTRSTPWLELVVTAARLTPASPYIQRVYFSNAVLHVRPAEHALMKAIGVNWRWGKFRKALHDYWRHEDALRARQALLEGDIKLTPGDSLVRHIEHSLHAYYASIAAMVLSDRQVVGPYAEIAYKCAIRATEHLDQVAHLPEQPTPEERRAWRSSPWNPWNGVGNQLTGGQSVYHLSDITLSLAYPLTERFHDMHDRLVVDKRLRSISDYVNGATFLHATVGEI